jgi:hypothetical protein
MQSFYETTFEQSGKGNNTKPTPVIITLLPRLGW